MMYNNMQEAMKKLGISAKEAAEGISHMNQLWKDLYQIDYEQMQSMNDKFNISIPKETFNLFTPEEQEFINNKINPDIEETIISAQKGTTRHFKTRILLRYDSLDNWEKNADFVPLKGEVCIVEDMHETWQGYKERNLVIGNGVHTVMELLEGGHFISC